MKYTKNYLIGNQSQNRLFELQPITNNRQEITYAWNEIKHQKHFWTCLIRKVIPHTLTNRPRDGKVIFSMAKVHHWVLLMYHG